MATSHSYSDPGNVVIGSVLWCSVHDQTWYYLDKLDAMVSFTVVIILTFHLFLILQWTKEDGHRTSTSAVPNLFVPLNTNPKEVQEMRNKVCITVYIWWECECRVGRGAICYGVKSVRFLAELSFCSVASAHRLGFHCFLNWCLLNSSSEVETAEPDPNRNTQLPPSFRIHSESRE